MHSHFTHINGPVPLGAEGPAAAGDVVSSDAPDKRLARSAKRKRRRQTALAHLRGAKRAVFTHVVRAAERRYVVIVLCYFSISLLLIEDYLEI